jgi:uncharacterized membrane protein YgcG
MGRAVGGMSRVGLAPQAKPARSTNPTPAPLGHSRAAAAAAALPEPEAQLRRWRRVPGAWSFLVRPRLVWVLESESEASEDASDGVGLGASLSNGFSSNGFSIAGGGAGTTSFLRDE